MHRSIRRRVAVGLATVTVSALVAVAGASAAVAAPSSSFPKGIDVSEWQSHFQGNPDVNWAAQKAAGVQFALIKASGGYKVTNEAFADQWNGAYNAGLIRGAYHLAAPNLPSTNLTKNALTQADYFASKASDTAQGKLWSAGGQTLPPVLDIEKNNQQTTINACFGMTPTQLQSWIKSYLAEVTAKVGRTPIIYTSRDFWTECVGNSTKTFAGTALWQASYDSTVGAIPSSWATWTMWQWREGKNTAGNGGTDYDQDVYNGTLTSLHLLADPTYGHGTSTAPRLHDFNGDKKNDLLVVSSAGGAYFYKGNAKGYLLSSSSVAMGSGLKSYNAFAAVGKIKSSGYAGLYARSSSGTLYYFPIGATGKLGTRVTAAKGWSALSNITSAGDFNGDGIADLVAVDKVGVLWAYLGAGNGTFKGRVQFGSGWNSKTALVGAGDFTGDGNADLLARDSAGRLALYTHTPSSGSLRGATLASSGWNSYKRLFTPGDITGDGKADLIGVGTSGKTYLFPGTGKAATSFAARKAFGSSTSWGTRLFVG
ncbi:GH25 family lysozyme [Frondihabitans sp. 4ASC-45]|uniref:GH25 family lysozyme n=1 Tax=Frondihabitans sp. 4ASC-45 TaxID=3111636 RepID=UPI003C1C9E8F